MHAYPDGQFKLLLRDVLTKLAPSVDKDLVKYKLSCWIRDSARGAGNNPGCGGRRTSSLLSRPTKKSALDAGRANTSYGTDAPPSLEAQRIQLRDWTPRLKVSSGKELALGTLRLPYSSWVKRAPPSRPRRASVAIGMRRCVGAAAFAWPVRADVVSAAGCGILIFG